MLKVGLRGIDSSLLSDNRGLNIRLINKSMAMMLDAFRNGNNWKHQKYALSMLYNGVPKSRQAGITVMVKRDWYIELEAIMSKYGFTVNRLINFGLKMLIEQKERQKASR